MRMAVTLARQYEASARAMGLDPAWLLDVVRRARAGSDEEAEAAVRRELVALSAMRARATK